MSRKPRGIEELLRRWLWRLPEDCDPVRVDYCHTCGENVLVVHGPDGETPLTRKGRRHYSHPRSRSLPMNEDTDSYEELVLRELGLDRHRHDS